MVERVRSIVASLERHSKVAEEHWQVRCHQLKNDGEADGTADNEEPSLVKFVEWANKIVILLVLLNPFFRNKEATVRQDENHRSIEVLHNKDRERFEEVDLSCILWTVVLADFVEDHLTRTLR